MISGRASNYANASGEATVALPIALGGGIPEASPRQVLVCADRCVLLPVVDSCPCYVGTADQRVANLSHEAWALVTDAPLAEGLVQVELYMHPVVLPSVPPSWGPPKS